MNFDFSHAADSLTLPIVGGVIAAVVIVGTWKGAKALLKSIRAENQRKAEIQADLEEVRRVVTPIEFPSPRRSSTHQL